MKKNQIVIALIAFLIIIAVLTNPNQDRHKEVVKTKINAIMQKSLSEELSDFDDVWGNAGQALGMMLGGVVIDGIIANAVSTDNYLIFSTTKFTWEGNTKVIGIGAFGNVYISSQLEKGFKEALSKE
ncbi:MAG TPA: DUF4359 domain-containing protein [Chitinophagales bacterium]|nr:DUF4359 domain-containing protein [Chitinophagales bacterium]